MKISLSEKKGRILMIATAVTILIAIAILLIRGNVASTELKPKKYHFVCLFSGDNKEFEQHLKNGIEDAMNNYDVWVTLETFSSSDLDGHTESFDKAIESQVDGIITNVPSTKEIGKLIDKAALRKIPVITIVNDINGSQRKAFIGIDYNNCGRRAVEILSEKTDSVAKVIVAIPESSENDLESRQKSIGISEASKDSRNIILYKTNITKPYYPNAYSAYVDAFSSDMVCNSIIGINDTITMAAVHYVKNYPDKKVRIIGMGNSQSVFEALKDGYIDVVLTEDANYVGKTAVEYLTKYKQGRQIPRRVYTDIYEVTKDNVGEYMEERP